MKLKKFLSLLLSAAMAFSLLTATAFAAAPAEEENGFFDFLLCEKYTYLYPGEDGLLYYGKCHAHPEFPRIVFHGLRHSSATYQLMISGGDVKAVQGTTGHATADMLVNTYAHIQ